MFRQSFVPILLSNGVSLPHGKLTASLRRCCIAESQEGKKARRQEGRTLFLPASFCEFLFLPLHPSLVIGQ